MKSYTKIYLKLFTEAIFCYGSNTIYRAKIDLEYGIYSCFDQTQIKSWNDWRHLIIINPQSYGPPPLDFLYTSSSSSLDQSTPSSTWRPK